MVKSLIFDLDGVLIDLKEVHYEALNIALREIGDQYTITLEEHYSTYDGLPTRKKLNMLTDHKGLPADQYDKIYELKQRGTIDYIINHVEKDEKLIQLFQEVKEMGLTIAVASNSIRNTIYTVLVKLGIINYVDHVISNQDVHFPKPNPEMYLIAISRLGHLPDECVIFEDSPYGYEAAKASGGNVVKVKNAADINKENIIKNINHFNMDKKDEKWDGKNWNILIPMAGAGSRFANAGYTFPKPLIEVRNKPMIQVVTENLNIDAHFIYIVQKKHYEQYNLKYLLNLLTPNCTIVQVDGLTEGAACTTLLAKEYFDDDKHLLIANSDQFMEWDSNRFYYTVEDEDVDGGILCFESTHPKWSYAKLDDDGFVTEVAEKKPISDKATVGIYYWKKGSDYIKYAEQMIEKEIRVNNEFYVCPVYNESIGDNQKVKTYNIDKMWGLGTPEDLNYYLDHFNE
jgi:HAD superfamily hydrolase (TIGR01509 family)